MLIKSTIPLNKLQDVISIISTEPDISTCLDHFLISKYEYSFDPRFGVKIEIQSENLDFLQRVIDVCKTEG